MSESKSTDSEESGGIDELDELRAQHALSSSPSAGIASRATERLEEESTL